jgi:serine/threonine protein kinase
MTSTVVPETLLASRYRLVHRLAGGGMGQVWRAQDTILGRPVVVKLLSSEFAEDQASLHRFRIEARRTAALSHSGIASVFDYGEIEEPNPTAYLVMELVEGDPLSVVLAREGRLDPERVLDVIAQAALALTSAHQAGVVHRDIKASNLVIRRDGVVKVTDFSLACTIGEAPRTEIGLVGGTPAYFSPEQVAGRPLTPASDVYALGVVAYECLAGRRPFSGEHPIGLALAHRRHPPPRLPSDIPVPVRALVERAMAKDARARPTADALAANAIMARTALLEERHQDIQVGGSRRPAGDRVRGSSGSPVISRLASTNGSNGNSRHGNGLRRVGGSHGIESPERAEGFGAQAHATDPDQDTGEWTPVFLMFTLAWSRCRRPLAVSAMLAVFTVLATMLTAATRQPTPTVMVPSVSGKPITTAAQLLVRAGFEVRERTQPNRSVRANVVLAQEPAAGRRLQRGTPVTLIVSTGPAAVTVDPADYIGQPLDTVRAALIRLRLRVTVETGPTTGNPQTVMGVTPSGPLRQGDTVTITASSSRRSASVISSSDGSAPLTQEHDGKVEHKHRHGHDHDNHD